jgi:hypothetical protein
LFLKFKGGVKGFEDVEIIVGRGGGDTTIFGVFPVQVRPSKEYSESLNIQFSIVNSQFSALLSSGSGDLLGGFHIISQHL